MIHESGRAAAMLVGRIAYGADDTASVPTVGDWVAPGVDVVTLSAHTGDRLDTLDTYLTPGLRELQLWGDAANLGAAFPDVETLAAGGRFRDCMHHGEPGCAVQHAVDASELDAERFESYVKLQRELRYLERRQDAASQRQQARQFSRMLRRVNRAPPRSGCEYT